MTLPLILMYHQVDVPRSEREHRFCIPPDEFQRQMTWLKENEYMPVGLDDIVSYVSGKSRLPEKAIHITFDDGFIGVFEHAAPVLKKLEIPSTLYVVSQRRGQTNDWMSTRGFPRRALLSDAQLRILSEEGIVIGSHTNTHARLSELSQELASKEILDSKNELEQTLGLQIDHFAYPFGLFNKQIRDLVEYAGYRSACSTRSGFNRPGEDVYSLRRIDIFGTDKLWQFRQKIQFGTNETSPIFKLQYYAMRFKDRLLHR